jgi:hypothetical protein
MYKLRRIDGKEEICFNHIEEFKDFLNNEHGSYYGLDTDSLKSDPCDKSFLENLKQYYENRCENLQGIVVINSKLYFLIKQPCSDK